MSSPVVVSLAGDDALHSRFRRDRLLRTTTEPVARRIGLQRDCEATYCACMCAFHNIRLDIVAFIVGQLLDYEGSEAGLTGIVPNYGE